MWSTDRLSIIKPAILILLLSGPALTAYSQQTYRDYYRVGIEAYKNGEYDTFLTATRKADSLRPNHPVLLYNLAAGYALNSRPDQAVATLNRRVLFYATGDFLEDEDFNTLKGAAGYSRLRGRLERLTATRKTSRTAFEIEHPGLHPEGIAYDGTTSRFIISDIRSGRLYSYDRNGADGKVLLDLTSWGYWSAMGLRADPSEPGILWVTTAALPEFEGYTGKLEGRSAVLAVNLRNGEIVRSYTADGNHLFGDLAVGSDGRVFVTDSRRPGIYTIGPGSGKLEKLYSHPDWWNLQGVALSEEGNTLYVSDYILGIYTVDLNTLSAEPLLSEMNVRTRGTDGLYRLKNRLIFLQNGTRPKRVGQVKLAGGGKAITESLAYTDQARPGLDEPTLGVRVDDELYYIANSPWAYYDEERRPETDEWPVLKIFRLRPH